MYVLFCVASSSVKVSRFHLPLPIIQVSYILNIFEAILLIVYVAIYVMVAKDVMQ